MHLYYLSQFFYSLSFYTVGSLFSGKNSELSDVSKPLSAKEKSGMKSSSSSNLKDGALNATRPLDGIDLNNIAGRGEAFVTWLVYHYMLNSLLLHFNCREQA